MDNQKIAIVTGGSRGIGLGLVRELLVRGHGVVAACRNPDTAEDLKKLLAEGGQPAPVKCDVASDESISECYNEVLIHFRLQFL